MGNHNFAQIVATSSQNISCDYDKERVVCRERQEGRKENIYDLQVREERREKDGVESTAGREQRRE